MTDMSGTYGVVANTPMGDQKMTITIKVEGAGFTGTSSGSMGSSDITGSVEGDTIKWKQGITVPMPLTLDCQATITGDEIKGSVDTGSFGSFPILGKRV